MNEFDPQRSVELGELIDDYKRMDTSSLFTLNIKDFAKGAVAAAFSAAIVAFAGVVGQVGFNAFNADWKGIGNMVLVTAVGAFIGYLGKNFFSDSRGKFVGKIG